MTQTIPLRSALGPWAAGALGALLLVGCGRPDRAETYNAPQERVAGERQESDAVTIARLAGLPETFAFGGRTWRAHQVHRVTPGAGDADAGAPTPERIAEARETDGFRPIADFQVEGRQIYGKRDLDETLTDNIYLRAENVAAPDASGVDSARTGVAFIEYDADETAERIDLSRAMRAASLPQTAQVAGRSWKADDVQVWDADVFDGARALPGEVQGHRAYQGADRNTLFLMVEGGIAAAPSGPGNAPEPAQPPGETPGETPGERAAAAAGPFFIRYTAQK